MPDWNVCPCVCLESRQSVFLCRGVPKECQGGSAGIHLLCAGVSCVIALSDAHTNTHACCGLLLLLVQHSQQHPTVVCVCGADVRVEVSLVSAGVSSNHALMRFVSCE